MAFEPDIIVTRDQERILVVDAKLTVDDFVQTELALKEYMAAAGYPFGLLITPEKAWLYCESYSGVSPFSVECIEESDSRTFWRYSPPRQPIEFESFVQQWIEDLPNFPIQSLPPRFKDIVRSFVLPAIAAGEVRAAHPR